MNWKDVPNLFANGKFKVTNQSNDIFILDGYVCKQLWVSTLDSKRAKMFDPKNCTLIARKIEDMSDEEFELLYNFIPKTKAVRDSIINSHNPDTITLFEALQFMELGFYPFEWDETVIDSATL